MFARYIVCQQNNTFHLDYMDEAGLNGSELMLMCKIVFLKDCRRKRAHLVLKHYILNFKLYFVGGLFAGR